MIDLFHLQLIKGNITNTLNDLKSHIGHVQVSALAVLLNGATDMGQVKIRKSINFKTIFNFFLSLYLLLSSFESLFCSPFLLLFIESARFGGGDVVSLFFLFVIRSCLFFFCDQKLCDVYLCIYLPVCIGTWQVGGASFLIYFLEISI